MVDAVLADALVLRTSVRVVEVLINLAHHHTVGVAAADVDGHSVSCSNATVEGRLGNGVAAVAGHPSVGVGAGGRHQHLHLGVVEHHLATAVADATVEALAEFARQQVDGFVAADVQRRTRGLVAAQQGVGGNLLPGSQFLPLQRAS